MANKIKCTCGHSWDKSDSSKKDAYVCHLCGKDTRSDVPKAQVGEEVPAQKITPEMIQGWEEYRNYLDKQGLYGDPRLNTGFGKKTFVDWSTKNPKYGVNWETLPIIGQELAAHKKNIIQAVNKGKVSLNTPVSEFNSTDVTNAKSKNPWWPGTEFTAQEFANHEEQILDPKGKVIKEKNFGVLPSTETYDENKLRLDKKEVAPISGVKAGAIPNKKNGGWLDKYDFPEAQNGIEGTMGGLTDKGFNYNGAWGGPSMQFGGNLPGAVGSMYARTGAPSKGPRRNQTDVTDASAQNGKEMKFYQEGLDWKPRNISKNGGWLNKYKDVPKAQMGTMATPLDFSKPIGTLEGVSEVMSAPARTATYLLTGKYQDPSQALGIKNPWGALAADMVLDPLNLIGVGSAAKQAIKFKPKPGMMYRGLGKEGFEDAVESGVFRPKQHGYAEGRSLAEKVTTPKQFGSTFYAPSDKFNVVENYGSKYVAEVPFDEATFARRYGRKDWSWSTGRQIPVDEGRILKKDWLRGYKEVKPSKKKEDGGDIKKDDNGYWNPDNWGKPVEIGSNNITMQGVYEPLLGVSDKGDVQYMEPGKDYKFKGKKVTEYPIKKNGGWLDKYK